MSNTDTIDFHLQSLNANENMNTSLSSSSSSFLSSSYPFPAPTFSTSQPITNPEAIAPSISNHPARVTSTPAESGTKTIVKAKRSLVWRYFTPVSDHSLNVECILCSCVILRKTTSTSNLLYHIQIHHNVEYLNLTKTMKSKTKKSDLSGRLPLTSDRALHLNHLIANLIIHNFLPLSILESPYLHEVFREVEPSFIIPSRKYFTNTVLKAMYDDVRKNVYAELQASSGILN